MLIIIFSIRVINTLFEKPMLVAKRKYHGVHKW